MITKHWNSYRENLRLCDFSQQSWVLTACRRLEKLVLPSIFDTSLSSLMIWNLQTVIQQQFQMKECDILGVKTWSDPSYIFSWGQLRSLPIPRIYTPDVEKHMNERTHTVTSCRRVAAMICLRPLQVDNMFVFIRQVAPVSACWLFKTSATSWPFTFWPWKWCPSHVWRGPPLYQF